MDLPIENTMSWKIRAIRSLGAPSAPRVFDTDALNVWLKNQGADIPLRTVRRAISEWENAGIIRRASRGHYLNLQSIPTPTLSEVACQMRPGAIVSLSTVLGQAGVLNNPTHWVTAVMPSDNPTRPPNQVASKDGSMLVFAAMKPELLSNPRPDWQEDALQPYAPVPTATPEKALLDWIYVASRGKGVERWAMPSSHDWDISDLDTQRLDRLATDMDLVEELAHFCQSLDAGPKIKPKRFTQ